MSVKKNILGSYVNQIYMTIVNSVMVPLHMRYMGTGVISLISFFATLQARFQLLDMGLTPTTASVDWLVPGRCHLVAKRRSIGCCLGGKDCKKEYGDIIG